MILAKKQLWDKRQQNTEVKIILKYPPNLNVNDSMLI